jgi:hypothetical protein
METTVMADKSGFAAKIDAALAEAAACQAQENSDAYTLLEERLHELEDMAAHALSVHPGTGPLVRKLQAGEALSAEELETLRALIVGDAEYYLKYDDDYDRAKTELAKIFAKMRTLEAGPLEAEALAQLRVLCQESYGLMATTVHYLEQKERIRHFEEATRGPIDREAGRLLANIIREVTR